MSYLTLVLIGLLGGAANGKYPFWNTSLPWTDRVSDLVGRLTLDEIVLQMASTMPAPAIDRLGISPFDWGTECLRGDVGAGAATAFPQALGLAATFSTTTIYRVAEATGVEVRAKNNNYTKYHLYGYHRGINCFSPVINIMRHPLWGRNQETYGEDPFMSGLYAQHFVAGLQGDHPRYVRASAGCKHFDAYAGPDNIPVPRVKFNAVVSNRDWRLTFLPAFRMCVEAGTYGLMCSYNSVNGIPSCAHKELLTDILRDEWGFTGFVISDMGAVEGVYNTHYYVNDSVQAAAACINAGCNLDLNDEPPRDAYINISRALDTGMLSMKTILERMRPLIYTRMRLGEFDPPEMNPYTKIPLSVLESEPHVMLSREAAVQSYVLLKNQEKFLPLKYSSGYKQVAIVGPMSDNAEQMFGEYAANVNPRYTTTPYDSLKSLGQKTNFAAGCSNTNCTDYNRTAVVSAVEGSSVVFVVLGTGQAIEGERNDRSDMYLPGDQLQLLQDAVTHASGAPVILVLFNCGPVDISWADQSTGVTSIIECFFPAQEAGAALLQVLLGEESPAGRLPYTWYRSVNQTPGITNYTMHERTYRYFTGDPLYPFGYGLSYSNFTYTTVSLGRASLVAGQDQNVSVSLYNSGQVISDEVVQVYIAWTNASTPVPNLQLVAYDRLRGLSPSETSLTVTFTISAHHMAQWDDTTKQFFIESGEIQVYAGGQQPNQRRSVGSNVLWTSFQITGHKYLRGL